MLWDLYHIVSVMQLFETLSLFPKPNLLVGVCLVYKVQTWFGFVQVMNGPGSWWSNQWWHKFGTKSLWVFDTPSLEVKCQTLLDFKLTWNLMNPGDEFPWYVYYPNHGLNWPLYTCKADSTTKQMMQLWHHCQNILPAWRIMWVKNESEMSHDVQPQYAQ